MAVLRLRELATARALELPALRRGYVLVAFQEERELRNLLVLLSATCAAELVCKNSQNRHERHLRLTRHGRQTRCLYNSRPDGPMIEKVLNIPSYGSDDAGKRGDPLQFSNGLP